MLYFKIKQTSSEKKTLMHKGDYLEQMGQEEAGISRGLDMIKVHCPLE